MLAYRRNKPGCLWELPGSATSSRATWTCLIVFHSLWNHILITRKKTDSNLSNRFKKKFCTDRQILWEFIYRPPRFALSANKLQNFFLWVWHPKTPIVFAIWIGRTTDSPAKELVFIRGNWCSTMDVFCSVGIPAACAPVSSASMLASVFAWHPFNGRYIITSAMLSWAHPERTFRSIFSLH